MPVQQHSVSSPTIRFAAPVQGHYGYADRRDEGRMLVLFDESRNDADGHFSCKPSGALLCGRSAALRALPIVGLFDCGSRLASHPATHRRGPMGFCITLLGRSRWVDALRLPFQVYTPPKHSRPPDPGRASVISDGNDQGSGIDAVIAMVRTSLVPALPD